MEKIKIIAIDPSLRNTGYCVMTHNTETNETEITNCGVLRNPAKFKGLEAVFNKIIMVRELLQKPWVEDADHFVVEVPAPINMFQARFHGGAMISVATIAGAVAALIDSEKLVLTYPHDWNERKKKEKTQEKIQEIYGPASEWKYDHKVNQMCMEHILDAAGMAHWLLTMKYIYE